jgi:hypothetical protein
MSDSFVLAQEGPSLLPLQMLQATFTEDKLAQLVEYQPRFGMAASLTEIVWRLHIVTFRFAHRSSPPPPVAYPFDSVFEPDAGFI